MLKDVKKGVLIKAKNILDGEEVVGYVVNDPTPKNIAVKTNDGRVKIIDTLTFVITVLPMVDSLLDWIIKIFKRLFKK